tara:strand:+ start:559 stop:774 length:216 start_codon:yes stop_codon:yes gene_type:complete
MKKTNDIKVFRQVHLVASAILVSGLALGQVSENFMILAYLVAFGLVLHGISGFCPMELIIRKLPWNSEKKE